MRLTYESLQYISVGERTLCVYITFLLLRSNFIPARALWHKGLCMYVTRSLHYVRQRRFMNVDCALPLCTLTDFSYAKCTYYTITIILLP